ncbi:hypothetical protein [Actinophytocola sp. KF-1]
MTLVNLTPHLLCVMASSGAVLLELPRCEVPARMTQEVVRTETLPAPDGPVPVDVIGYLHPIALPPPRPGTWYVVSRVVARDVPRADLVFPDEEVRDDRGAIIGCRRLARFHQGSFLRPADT